MNAQLKKYNTIGCCGIDCGLCPRFHTKGDSACPGCGGPDFKSKHPSCGFVSCCVIKKDLEVCSECESYACSRFDSEKQGYDSFVTHKNVFVNLDFIKSNEIELFIDQQKKRIAILSHFIEQYDNGRSKSFFCISCALLPLNILTEIHKYSHDINKTLDIQEKNKLLKEKIMAVASDLGIDLKLNTKK
jgi:hypothetical protein